MVQIRHLVALTCYMYVEEASKRQSHFSYKYQLQKAMGKTYSLDSTCSFVQLPNINWSTCFGIFSLKFFWICNIIVTSNAYVLNIVVK